MMPTSTLRARLWFVAAVLLTMGLGLAVHLHAGFLPAAARDVLGDALWAAMIAWWMGVLAPHAALRRRALAALGICLAVELGQLYHAPGIDAVRHTMFGHLVLGSDFDPRDLAAYALGVLGAVLVERGARRRRASSAASSLR